MIADFITEAHSGIFFCIGIFLKKEKGQAIGKHFY